LTICTATPVSHVLFCFLKNQTTCTSSEQEQQLAAEIPEHLQIMEATCSKYQFFSFLAPTGS